MQQSASVTIRLDPDLLQKLADECKASKRTRSDVIREALERQLALQQFERLRRQAMPFAEAAGFLTDEDVIAVVS